MPDICTIGESVNIFEDDIHFISEAIVHELDHSSYFNDALMDTLKAIVFEQPHKQHAIALIILVVNKKNPNAGKTIFNHCLNEFQRWLREVVNPNFKYVSNETGAWNRIKLLLRFTSLLSPMINTDELISIFKTFFEIVIDINKEFPEQRNPLAEMIYTNTLMNIPYLFFFDRINPELNLKVDQLLNYVENNYKPNSIQLELTNEFTNDVHGRRLEYSQVILPNVKAILSNDKKLLFNFFPNYMNLLPTQPNRIKFMNPIKFPLYSDLISYNKLDTYLGSVTSTWYTPKYNFQILMQDNICDFETVMPFDSYQGFLLKDIITDIVESMEFNMKEVARQVFTLDMFFNRRIFAPPGISIPELEKLKANDNSISTYKLEDIAIETILSLMFNLPTVTQSFCYYFNLLVNICNESSRSIAPIFGRAFRFLFRNLISLDFELILRYLDWFSFQISNFKFSWKWSEWEDEFNKIKNTPYHPKNIFIRNLIKKELRLTSNKIDIEESLTAPFKECMYDGFFSNDILTNFYNLLFEGFGVTYDMISMSNMIFNHEDMPMNDIVSGIIDYFHEDIKTKNVSSLETLLETLRKDHMSIIKDYDEFVTILLTHCLLYSGRRSLSHTNKYISDFYDDFTHIFNTRNTDKSKTEFWIIKSTLMFWNSNSQTAFLTLDGFRQYGLVSSNALIRFCLKDEDGKIPAIIDSTATEATLRVLHQDVSHTEDIFDELLGIFDELCKIIKNSFDKKGDIHGLKDTGLMTLDENIENMYWKYSMSLRFLKTILRMFTEEYKLVEDSLLIILDNTIAEPVIKAIINKYITELTIL
ncbi:hypothetical protein TPHA_0G02740 [Tetrapisispora phaffii CBS 4417]|uniref:MIF4G domain-containing protein n=1 Tax=Tetrapisispora phaffii (strain ATCC 24235 / CBS 4417 / NBRC 1672 / NRRL Y-8282 / UCD 70-5) TaxID=1071381 RepID=G8BW33_TETPH|nr:hypothetical protein TPHA_0G02740 [Tetrapisispora phaffii CBS 4417]CCE64111.1 hypothetical protein TPHA_0G02740 [Tetrapisispora phaffii CBS 4417]